MGPDFTQMVNWIVNYLDLRIILHLYFFVENMS